MTRRPASRLGEFEMINRMLKPLAQGFAGALGLADDAALVTIPEGRQLVIAKDAMVADVHFLASDPPDLVAGKLLRVNLSDLAAMGAEPLGYLTALMRPSDLGDGWLATFWEGLAREQREFGLHLLGGDTCLTTGPLALSLTILGTVPSGGALLRSGARPADDLWVSGSLGDAALGLRVLRGLAADDDQALHLIDRYRTPRPRLELGRSLRGIATAAIDISDGLVADAGHIARTSGTGIEIAAAALPLSVAARGVPGAMEAALSGGDDYELLFTAAPERRGRVDEAAARAAVPVARIGRVIEGVGVSVLSPDGHIIEAGAGGWRHF